MYSLNEDWLYSFLTPKNYHQPHINYEKSENSESEFFEFKNSQDSENSENAKSPKTPKSPKIPIGTMKSPNPSQNWTPTRSFKSEWTPSELWIEFRKFYMLPMLFENLNVILIGVFGLRIGVFWLWIGLSRLKTSFLQTLSDSEKSCWDF